MKKKALVIDDNQLVRETLKAMLEFFDFEVSIAENGLKALKKFSSAKESNQPFDIVFVDLVMAEMHGREVMEELLKIDPKVKAVISSGFSSDPLISDYKKQGFKEILNKPYTIDELKDILTQLNLL